MARSLRTTIIRVGHLNTAHTRSAGVCGSNEWWFSNNEIHEAKATGPFAGHRDDQFVVQFFLDVTPSGGERMQMNEVGQVKCSGRYRSLDASEPST